MEVEEFLKEAAVMKEIKHPNLVQLLGNQARTQKRSQHCSAGLCSKCLAEWAPLPDKGELSVSGLVGRSDNALSGHFSPSTFMWVLGTKLR